MIRVLITNDANSVEIDYTRYVVPASLKISRTLSAPSTCTFQMSNFDLAFQEPKGRSYLRVISTNHSQALFTGYMPAVPTKQYTGLKQGAYNKTHNQLFNLQYSYTSDEYLLNIKAVPFIPAYINMHAGDILKSLAQILCPGMFDFTNCQPGPLVPYQAYDPSQSWSQLAKALGDPARFRYHVINHEVHFQPYGDGPLGIAYDEDKPTTSFKAAGLVTSPLIVPIVNDVTIIGDQEAGNSHEDYFIGTGFDGAFPLRHQVFDGGSDQSTNGTVLISDAWSENQIDTNTWTVQDPESNLNPVDGSMNVLTPLLTPNNLGESYIVAQQAIELAGGIVLQHGEFVFDNASKGLVGGLYTAETLTIDDCLCAFQIDYGPNVDVSASGAAGVSITPICPNFTGYQFTPASVITKINKSYVLTTSISAPAPSRFTRVYQSLGGVVYGGTSLNDETSGTITWQIEETDQFTGQQTIYTGSLQNVPLPAYCVYALINNEALNLNFNTTQIYKPPLGSLNICSEVGAGMLSPIYISGNLQYTGAYVTPSGGNLPIYPISLGQEHAWPLGSSLQNQSAEVDIGNTFSTLNFYSDDLPGVGVRIKLSTWESQAALSRVRDPNSVLIEAATVGDDGVRATTVSNLSPLPRTSEDCDAAAQAYLSDRTQTYYNGTYTAESTFMQQYLNELEYWPVPGRMLYINAPQRGLVKQNVLVSSVTISFLELVGEILLFAISFGPDLKLEKTMPLFVFSPANTLLPQNATIQLTPQQLAQVGSTYLPDVIMSVVDQTSITCSGCQLNLSDPIPAVTGHVIPNSQQAALTSPFYELRTSDFNWGIVNAHLIGRFTSNGPVWLVRTGYENIFYIRLVQLDTNGNVVATSRRSKVIRIVYPLRPTPPAFLYADSSQMKFDYSGDIRNIEGIELLAAQVNAVFPPGGGGVNSPPIVIVGTGVATLGGFSLPEPEQKMQLSNAGTVNLPGTTMTGSGTTSIPESVIAAVTARFGAGAQVTVTAQSLIWRGIVGSEEDMMFNLNSLRGNGLPGSNINANLGQYQYGTVPAQCRDFVVRFFNLMWDYSDPTAVSIPIPETPIITENYKFGPSLCLSTSGTARSDIQYTHLQISADPSFGSVLLDSQVGGPNATFTVNVPATGALYARAAFVDYISPGNWSPVLLIPQASLISSSYLAAQGSVPPAITSVNGGGGLLAWSTTSTQIILTLQPFTLRFPDGTSKLIASISKTFTQSLDAGPIVANTLYGFFPAIQGAVTTQPQFQWNGPYANYTSSSLLASLGTQVADGSTPLSSGAITVQTQVAGGTQTGGSGGGSTGGGGGGGTGGGVNCGIMSAKILLPNGTRCTLSKTHVGMEVMNVHGKHSRIVKRCVVNEETYAITTESGKRPIAALGHSVYSNGKWRFWNDIIATFQEDGVGTLRNDHNQDEKIIAVAYAGKQRVCRIELAPIDATLDEATKEYWHIYSLDGIQAHNIQKA